MGPELKETTSDSSPGGNPPTGWMSWLDRETAAAVADTVQSVVRRHPEVRAVILFGSVARREERPLDDPQSSDVDLLLILDPSILDPAASRLTHDQQLALFGTLGEADHRHRRAPRALNVLLANRDLGGWDELFVENVARDGLLLWARDPLPPPLAAVEARGGPHRLPPS